MPSSLVLSGTGGNSVSPNGKSLSEERFGNSLFFCWTWLILNIPSPPPTTVSLYSLPSNKTSAVYCHLMKSQPLGAVKENGHDYL